MVRQTGCAPALHHAFSSPPPTPTHPATLRALPRVATVLPPCYKQASLCVGRWALCYHRVTAWAYDWWAICDRDTTELSAWPIICGYVTTVLSPCYRLSPMFIGSWAPRYRRATTRPYYLWVSGHGGTTVLPPGPSICGGGVIVLHPCYRPGQEFLWVCTIVFPRVTARAQYLWGWRHCVTPGVTSRAQYLWVCYHRVTSVLPPGPSICGGGATVLPRCYRPGPVFVGVLPRCYLGVTAGPSICGGVTDTPFGFYIIKLEEGRVTPR